MNDAGLMEGLWIDDLYSFSHALQAIRNSDENVLNASGLQPVKDGHPEACTLILGDPHALFFTAAPLRILTRRASKKATGYTLASGRFCHSWTSSSTLSVTLLT